MADTLRPRLEELCKLTKKLNSSTDRIGEAVQTVEAYLTDHCRLGMQGSVVICSESGAEEEIRSATYLVYGRYGDKFRIYVEEADVLHGEVVGESTQTLWANLPRDLKLESFRLLPELLDKLIEQVKDTLVQVETSVPAWSRSSR